MSATDAADLRRRARAAAEPEDVAPPAVPETPSHWQRLDLAELPAWDCPELDPIVDGIIARGNLVYLAAASQTGKTLLGVYLARKLVSGGQLFGRYPITPVDRLLYLVLEDPGRRIRDRLRDTDHEFPVPVERGRCVFYVAPGFALTEARALAWLEHIITTERRPFVFLDTYQRATPGIASFDDERQSVILHALSNMTRRLDITLLILDHVRKAANGPKRKGDLLSIDDIKGTGGKAQNADCVILMDRTPNRKQIRFIASSKDFDAPVRVLLNVAPAGATDPKFTVAGDLDTLGAESRERGERTRVRILEALPAGQWVAGPDVAQRLGMARTTVAGHLRQLAAMDRVEDNGAEGRWRMYRLPADNGNAATNNGLPLGVNA